MPVYIPPNRNLIAATSEGSGGYTKVESDSRFVHNFGNELINGIKIFPNQTYFNNSIKILNITPGKVLTTTLSGEVISTPYAITDLSLTSATNAEIGNRVDGDNYLQQQINQIATAQYLVFSEQFSGNGVSKQYQLQGSITNAQFVSGGWNSINVQNALPSNITDINGSPIYDAGILSLFTRHRIGVSSITGSSYVNLDYIPQNNQIFKLWYWYSLTDTDRIDNYYRDDFVAKMETDFGELATGTAVNTVNFNGVLTSLDNTVQKALETIDDVVISKSEVAIVSGYLYSLINSTSVSGYATNSAVAAASANALAQANTVSLSNAISYSAAASANALAQANTVSLSNAISYSAAASANALAQANTITYAASANALVQANTVSLSNAISYSIAASANSLAQSKTITFAASANALAQANIITFAVSANLIATINGVSQSLSGYVPYSSASSDVNLGAHKITTDSIIVNNSSIAPIPRQISWNDLDKTFNMGLTSEVTLQVGQEELTRVYNGNVYNIFSGQPVYITNIINDNPSVSLAGATLNKNGTRVAGIATETISSGGTGFITTKGKVRGINTSGYTTGDQIYLGEISGTFTNQTSGFAYQSHVNPLGYIGIVDPISGSIYVTITTESTLLSLSERETNVVLGNSISTGVYEFSGMTGIGSNSFVIPPLKGWIVENTGNYSTAPIVTNVVYNGGTFPVTDITTQDFTFILINKTNNITQQSTFPTPQQRRDNIFLGKLVHLNRSTINIINNIVDYDTSPFPAMRDMFVPMPIINEGVVLYPDGPNLSFNKSSGKLYGLGINWTNNQKSPNTIILPAATNISGFFYSNQFSRSTTPTNFIDPTNYDVGGVITTIGGGSNTSTNQRVYQFTTGTVIVQYGQNTYSTLSNAVANVNSEMFVRTPAVIGSAVLIGIISMVKGATNLSDTNQAIFSPVSMFGESTGGTVGTSTTTLQQAYNNSIDPEILTNNILGAMSFRRGSNNETDNVIEIQNGIGINVFTVNGFGETVISSISGINGSIVTHDASGKLLNSGILINSLTPLTTTSNISAYLDTLTSNSSANALIQSNSFTINVSANLQQQISIISQSQSQGLTGNYVSINKSETISGQKTFTSPITLTNGTTAQFYTSLITQTAPFNNFIVDQFNVGPFNGCNWDVVIKDNSNLRICNVMAGWINGQSSYTESNAPDIGDTSSVALTVSLISGGTVIALQSTAIGGSIWTIKSLRKCL